MPDNFNIEMFAEQVDSKFIMHYGNGQEVELRLLSATDIGSSGRQVQFSIIFQGPANAPRFQSIFKIEHEKLGKLDLFLVPIGRNSVGIKYEAVFNRLIK